MFHLVLGIKYVKLINLFPTFKYSFIYLFNVWMNINMLDKTDV